MEFYKKFLIAIYVVVLFYFLLFINLYYLDGVAHVPDSTAYLFMGKMFASGHIISKIPISPEHFDFFPGILSVGKGTWLFQYPFGHPLLLAIGFLVGFPNIIPPLVGAFSSLLLFLIAKKLFHDKTAFFVLFLPFFSPFFLENASEFMSHNTAAFYLLSSLYTLLIAIYGKMKIFFYVFSGIFLGLLFNTRPLTSAPFLFLFLGIILFKEKKEKINAILSFLIGFLSLVCLWFFYNYATSGQANSSQYFLVNKSTFMDFSLPVQTILSQGLGNVLMLLKDFWVMAFDFPVAVSVALIFPPLLFRKTTFWDIVFYTSLFTLPIAYFFYNGTFIMYGPRFWYEMLPFVFLLTARSFALFFSFRKKITLAFFILLGVFALGQLFSIIPSRDETYFSPLQLKNLQGFNYIDTKITDEIKNQKIQNAVIFVKDCEGAWWCFGSVFDQNSPKLDTDIVFAKDLGKDKNSILTAYFPQKTYYIYDYNKKELLPLEATK